MAKSSQPSDPIVGRRKELALLEGVLGSPEAELLALYGRRRVGKTHLVRGFFAPRTSVFFSITGEKDAPIAVQLAHFRDELARTFYGGRPLPLHGSWREAFAHLADAVDDHAARRPAEPVVLFFDELPWLATPRSGLLQAFDHVWNTRLCRVRQLRVVLCGSAASWMLDKLIHAKGGLHNRITRRMRLEPFTLAETSAFLKARRLQAGHRQVIETYLAVGGIPHYLKQMQRGRSAAQNIGQACFDRDGFLSDELERLFSSLFTDAGLHEALVRAIAAKRHGVTRTELLDTVDVSSGGGLNRRLRELEEAGFVGRLSPWGAKKKNAVYRLLDEYTWFYLQWIERAPKGVLAGDGASYWVDKAQTPAYRAWAGYAFEGLCLKHAHLIKRALGLGSVATEVGTWRWIPRQRSTTRAGAQIDLLFDRADGIINLCELKYAAEPFTITKAYARELRDKIAIFEEVTGTRKDVHLTLVTPEGLKRNLWSEDLVASEVTADALFAEPDV